MKISKEFKFEMAHKLHHSYTCKCQNIHGHSYRAIVSLESGLLNSDGVVMDFTKVKDLIGKLFDVLDHSLMVRDTDPVLSMLHLSTLAGHNKQLIICDVEPTAENIALWLAAKISNILGSASVQLFETATSCAEVVAPDDLKENTTPRMTFVGFATHVEFIQSLGEKIINRPFKESFPGFAELYFSNIEELIMYSLWKFEKHNWKGNWVEKKSSVSFNNLFEEFRNEVEELYETQDAANFNLELGDCLNYLIILNSLKYNFLKEN